MRKTSQQSLTFEKDVLCPLIHKVETIDFMNQQKNESALFEKLDQLPSIKERKESSFNVKELFILNFFNEERSVFTVSDLRRYSESNELPNYENYSDTLRIFNSMLSESKHCFREFVDSYASIKQIQEEDVFF